MTSRSHWKLLVFALLTSGCQSTGSMLPWVSSKDPVYISDQLASLETPQPIASGVGKPAPTTATTVSKSKIQQVSGTMSGPPVSASKVDELVRTGQAKIREAGQNDPIKLQQARDVLSEALALDPSSTSAHHSMAIVADLQQDWQMAELHYKQALQAKPQDASLLNDIGYSYLLQNRFHEATQYLNQALQFSPQHERAHVNMALLSLKSGDRVGAQNRLSTIYSPADAQKTLARLERDVQQAGGVPTTAAVATTNPPVNGYPNGAAQPLISQTPFQAPAIPVPNNAGQPPMYNASNAAANQPSRPIHVYPPGVEVSPESAGSSQEQQFYPQNQAGNYPAPGMAQPQYPQQQPYQQQFAPSQQQQYGAPSEMAHSQYNPGGLTPQNSNAQYPQPNHYANTPYSQSQSGFGPPVHPASQNNLGAPQGLLQQMNPQQPTNPPAYSNQGSPGGMNAPLAGLNAGPGALFPVGADQSQPANYGTPMPQPNSGANYGAFPVQQNSFPQLNVPPAQGGLQYPAGNNVLPAEQHMHQMQMRDAATQQSHNQPLNMHPASSSRYLPPQGGGSLQESRIQQYGPGQQPNSNAPAVMPYVGAANGNSAVQPSSSSPLAAYEQQLQNLDSQYNRTLQQMDGRGTALGGAPTQLR